MRSTFYITTAIFYANGPLHIGHCYESVLADSLARYHRARGARVHLLTGTDEHGMKIERKAAAAGRPPQAWVDEIAGAVRHVSDRLGISYDDFIRTSEPRHVTAVQAIFTRLWEQGDIYLDQYEGWYCHYDETFWPAGRVLPGDLCPQCSRPLEWTREPTYKFRLSKYASAIAALLVRPGFVVPESRCNEMLAFVRQGLDDIAVSRTTVAWGIPVPFDPAHTIYVWIDALSNYITALGYGTADSTLYRTFWPADLHVVGKDIARFHAVIWPALLLALGEPVPAGILGHGWLNVGGEKISKSRGNTVDPLPLIERYGVDAVRYYLLREMPFGPDGNYSEEGLVHRTNTDLANDLGNLLSRTTMMIDKFVRGVVPAPGAGDGVLEAATAQAVRAVEQHMERLQPADALAALFRLVSRANKYIEEQSPWSLAKKPAEAERLGGVPAGTQIRRGAPLFPRIQE
ncbi:MAG: metS1 [Firmicutes bacterium]|nr:metS1 [Bacillota bacterium]